MTKTDRLDSEKITANLKTKRVGTKILVYSSTTSTNDISAEYAKNKENNGLAIFTEEQTAGRGRFGEKWLTSRADSIICSVLLTEIKCSAELLSLACAVATAEAIDKCGQSKAKIKWPNDIILSGKKVAGILLESKQNDSHISYILGIGINCHQKKDSFPAELQTTATSVDIESRSFTDRISLAKRLLTSIDYWLAAAEKNSKKVIKHWSKLSILLGCHITVVFNEKSFTGNCIGIDPQKGLILQLETGGIRMFDAAHTTIAK